MTSQQLSDWVNRACRCVKGLETFFLLSQLLLQITSTKKITSPVFRLSLLANPTCNSTEAGPTWMMDDTRRGDLLGPRRWKQENNRHNFWFYSQRRKPPTRLYTRPRAGRLRASGEPFRGVRLNWFAGKAEGRYKIVCFSVSFCAYFDFFTI